MLSIGNLPKVPRVRFLESDAIFCFIIICKFGSFKNPLATIANEKNDFSGLWQQHKQLKTIDISEASPDTYHEGYIHQLQPEPTFKIH